MTDQIDDLMEAAEACVAEATPATLEPSKLIDPETRAKYWKAMYEETDAKRTQLQGHSEKLLLMVAKRDEKINDLEILVEGHRESIREYKHELEKLQADKELRRGIIHGQSEVIDDLRSQLETPINFDDDDE